MHAAAGLARMRLVAALLLLAFLPAATALPACTQFGCVVAQDTDGDGEIDWANVALSLEHAATANANMDDGQVQTEATVATEESLDPFHSVGVYAFRGPSESWVYVEVLEGDEETGSTQTLAAQFIRIYDADGDGAPESVELIPALP